MVFTPDVTFIVLPIFHAKGPIRERVNICDRTGRLSVIPLAIEVWIK